MVHKSEESLSIIEDVTEEQIIIMENADIKTRAMLSSL